VNEQRYRSISVTAVEVPNKLRDIFVNRSGGFKRRVIVSSLANEILVSLTTAAAIQNFSSVVFG
jgi:hypothetical protein